MEKEIEQRKDILDDLQDSILKTNLIQDNKYIFVFQGNMYRIVMPSQKQKSDAELTKNKLYLRLLHENATLPESERHKTKEQLRDILKISGVIDIDKLEEKRESLKKELNELYIELAQILSGNIEAIEQVKNKIITCRKEFENISIEISTWLMASIQDRLEKIYIEYLVHCCTEKCIKIESGDNWERVWKELEDYQNESSGLEEEAAKGMIALLYNVMG